MKLDTFFSDNSRLLKIATCIMIIMLAGVYGVITGPATEVTFGEMQNAPENYVGQLIPFGGKVVEKDNTLQLRDRGEFIETANIDLTTLKGETITGLAYVVESEGDTVLKIAEYHHHYGSQFKVISGPVVLGILAILFLRNYQFDMKKWFIHHA